MWRSENTVRRITAEIAAKFLTFGGGDTRHAEFNPLVSILSSKPAMFALGVDVHDVVAAVLSAVNEDEIEAAHNAKKKTHKARRR